MIMPQYTSQIGRQLNTLDPESENILSDEEMAAERDRLLSIYPQQWPGQERQMQPVEEPVQTEPIVAEPSALQTPPPIQTEPEPAELQPSQEPGKTVSVEKAMEEKPPMPKEEPDEFEQMFKTYQENVGKARGEYEQLQGEMESESARGQMETGIAGALQAFGEGLAAITGGSAKPVQTGAATMRTIGEQRIAGQERKARSLKERMMMAREPLETKKEELGFRDVFEKRQLQKKLVDPQSSESQQAREMANNFLDVYIANLENKAVDPAAIQRVEGVRGKIQSMNANQVTKFLENLKDVKFGTSYETTIEGKKELETEKAGAKLQGENVKFERKQQSEAEKRFLDDSAKLATTVQQSKQFSDQLSAFQRDVEAASRGDMAALDRVKLNRGVVNYLLARQKEPKGVFTDQDLAALSQFEAGKSWGETFQGWVGRGLGDITAKDLNRIQSVLADTIPIYQNAENKVIEQTKRIYKASDNKFLNQKAEKLTPELFGLTKTGEENTFETVDDAQNAINKGTIPEGTIVKIRSTGQTFKVGR